MLRKKHAAILLIVLAAVSWQPAPVHAGFFLFNIIESIFGGGHKDASKPAPPPAGGGLVKLGMHGSKVAAVQQHLIRTKYLSGKADGVFGYQTLQAVKAFQRDRGLADDGVVGPRTLSALEKFKGTRPKTDKYAAKPNRRPPPKGSGIPHYLYTLPVMVTAYTATDEGCTGVTYGGNVLRRGMVAVDPTVIPLGTRLYIPGYGEAIADDIGGAVIGNHIDLAMETKEEAFEWGVKHTTAYILGK